MNWYLKVLKNYSLFSGRARRSEYWYFILFNLIFSIVAGIIDVILGTRFQMGSYNLPYGYVYMLYSLIVLIPGLAVLVRRLHDIGKSGWWFFICIIPVIGWIWLLVLLFTDSNPGKNIYGENPKDESLPDIG